MIRFVVLLTGLWLLPPHAVADDDRDIVEELATVELPDPPLEEPPPEPIAVARTERLQKALRCPVCQGLSVLDSPSDAARAMGDRIEELVYEGYTEEQVTEYFVDRYGAWVELEPPTEDHQTLFVAPIAALTLGVLVLVGWARRKTSVAPKIVSQDSEPSLPTPDPSLAAWRTRILAELDGEAQ